MTTWQDALREFNQGKKYSIPKKGTKEYDAVKKIQAKLDKQNFKPHKMYEPKTGKAVKANTKAEHEKLGKKGYTHKKKGGMNNANDNAMFAPLMIDENTDTEDVGAGAPPGPRAPRRSTTMMEEMIDGPVKGNTARTKNNKAVAKGPKSGDGFIKDSFTGLVKRMNKQIDKLEPVDGDIPLADGEMHLKKIVRKDGKFKRQNYNYCGPGTQVEKRLARKDIPIDNIDMACQEHDVTYTNNFQARAKRGEKVSKKEVQDADAKLVMKVQLSKNNHPLFAAAVPKLFGAKKLAENTGLLPIDAFFNPKTTGSGMTEFGSEQINFGEGMIRPIRKMRSKK